MGTYAKVFEALLTSQRASGVTLSGGKVHFYVPGSVTTYKAIYADRGKQTPAANPYTLSSDGTAAIYGDGLYDVVIKTAAGVTVATWEDVSLVDGVGDRTSIGNYTDLTAAVTAIGATKTTLVIGSNQAVSADLTIPATLQLDMVNGAIITVATGKVLTINSDFSNTPAAQCFAGAGVVKFTTGSHVIKSEWFPAGYDFTATLQNSVTVVTTATSARTGGELVLEGLFNKTEPLAIAASSSGFRIHGGSSRNTIINQTTDNKAIFKFTSGNTNDFEIDHLKLSWTNQQTTANTASFAFDMVETVSDVAGGVGIYNFRLHHLTIGKGFRGICSAVSPYVSTVWGAHIHDILFHDMTGALLWLLGGASPNNHIHDVYSLCSTGTEPIFNLYQQRSLKLDTIEINTNTNGRVLMKLNECFGTIGIMRMEGATYTANSVFEIDNAFMEFQKIELQSITANPGGGNKWHVFKNGALTGSVNVRNINFDTLTISSGSGLFIDKLDTAELNTNLMAIDSIFFADNRVWLSDTTNTSAASGLYVRDWNKEISGINSGDNNITLTVQSEMIQYFSTELTGNKTVELPAATAVASDLFEGKKFRIVRDAATPGAFTLTVNVAGGGAVVTLPSATRAWCEVVYQRTAWKLIGYGTLI